LRDRVYLYSLPKSEKKQLQHYRSMLTGRRGAVVAILLLEAYDATCGGANRGLHLSVGVLGLNCVFGRRRGECSNPWQPSHFRTLAEPTGLFLLGPFCVTMDIFGIFDDIGVVWGNRTGTNSSDIVGITRQ